MAEADGNTRGFRLFPVVETLDRAIDVARSRAGLTYGLAATGTVPLFALLLGLEYLSSRRVFVTSYDYDWVIVAAALVFPLLVVWRSLCGGAIIRTTVGSLGNAPQAPGIFSAILQGLSQGPRELLAGLLRASVVWAVPVLIVVAVAKVDPEMDLAIRISLILTCVSLLIPIVVLLSAWTLLLSPRAAMRDRSGRFGGRTFARAIGLTFIMGFMATLLFFNLHMAVHTLLFLADALFGVDVSYWSHFLSLGHELYLVVLVGLTALIFEPVSWGAPALLWVDARVRRDAVDLEGALQAVRSAAPRRFATVGARRGSRGDGDREKLMDAEQPTSPSSSEPLSGPFALLLAAVVSIACVMVTAPAVAQDGLDTLDEDRETWQQSPGVTPDELRRARDLLGESDESWVDLEPLRQYADDSMAQARDPEEERFWRQIHNDVIVADSSWGDERQRALRTLRTRLRGPNLRELEDLSASEQSDLSAERVGEALDTVMRGKEYEDLAAQEVARQNPAGLLERRNERRQELEWLEDNCCGGDRGATGAPGSGIGSVPTGVFKIVGIVLLVVAVGFVVLAIIRRLTSKPTTSRPAEGLLSGVHGDEEEDALAHPPATWTGRAQQLAAAGNHRQAIRALYLALLVALHKATLIRYEQSCTNWEYQIEIEGAVRRGGTSDSVLGAFVSLTEVFDHVWYGEKQATQADFDDCLSQLATLEQALGTDIRGAHVEVVGGIS